MGADKPSKHVSVAVYLRHRACVIPEETLLRGYFRMANARDFKDGNRDIQLIRNKVSVRIIRSQRNLARNGFALLPIMADEP
jgi:hypothetical protein